MLSTLETLEKAITTAEDAQAKAENELIEYANDQKSREEVIANHDAPFFLTAVRSSTINSFSSPPLSSCLSSVPRLHATGHP